MNIETYKKSIEIQGQIDELKRNLSDANKIEKTWPDRPVYIVKFSGNHNSISPSAALIGIQ